MNKSIGYGMGERNRLSSTVKLVVYELTVDVGTVCALVVRMATILKSELHWVLNCTCLWSVVIVGEWVIQEREAREKLKKEKAEVCFPRRLFQSHG